MTNARSRRRSRSSTPSGATDTSLPGIALGLLRAILRHGWPATVAAVLLVLILGFAGARLNFFGTSAYNLAKALLPFPLETVDGPTPVIPVKTRYELIRLSGPVPLVRAAPCQDGDTVRISFETGADAWVSVFGIDHKKPYGLFQNSVEPNRVVAGKEYTVQFKLDDAIGEEKFYVIAAADRFTFAETIMPMLTVSERKHDKGAESDVYRLALPPEFAQDGNHCIHIKRGG